MKSEIAKHLSQIDSQANFNFYYNHIYSYHPEDFSKNKSLLKNFTPIFEKNEENGSFVTYLEHKNKPIFLSQFHPEKYKIVKKNLKRETFQYTSQIMQIFKKLIIENNQINQLST